MASASLDTRPAPSPTVTNPDLILPYGDASRDSCPSPDLQPQRPPSPSLLLDKIHSVPLIAQVAERISLNELRQRRSMSPQSPQSFSIRPSLSQLDNISEDEDNFRSQQQLSYMETTPVTIKEVYSKPRAYGWETSVMVHGSESSGSNLSENFENFDMGGIIKEDDSEYERQKFLDSPSGTGGRQAWVRRISINGEEDTDAEEWLAEEGGSERDSQSYSALSKRAELILENAKKRLMLMEGNLRGARHSLLVTPSTSLTSLRLASELNISSYKDRHARSALGFTSNRAQDTRSASNPVARSPRHTRGFSDTSFMGTRQPRTDILQPQETESHLIGSSEDNAGQEPNDQKVAWPLSRVIRSSRSQEAMRDSRLSSWGLRHDDSLYEKLPEAKPNLEPLNEDDAAGRGELSPEEVPTIDDKRSSPATSDLRAQMKDLKGRISSLQQRTREDSEKRRSMQSLQSLNSHTAAESWYLGTEGYNVGAAGTDSGVGLSLNSPRSIAQDVWEQDGSQASTVEQRPSHSRKDSADVADTKMAENDTYHRDREPVGLPLDDAENRHGIPDQRDDIQRNQIIRDLSDEKPTDKDDERKSEYRVFPEPDPNLEVIDDEDADDGTIYEEADAYLPAAERHEDRVDAFDYENFFLHSAMGTYSRLSRHSSFSSAESVETTKPESPKFLRTVDNTDERRREEEEGNEGSAEDDVPPLKKQPSSPRLPYFHRNFSITSISSATTTASFATATEGQGTEQQQREWESPISPASGASPSTPPSQTPLQSPTVRKTPSGQQLQSTKLSSLNISSAPSFPHIATQLSPRRRKLSISSGSGGNNNLAISNTNSPASANASPSSSFAKRSVTNPTPLSQHRPRPVSTVVSNLLDDARTAGTSGMKLPPADKALVYSLAESLRVICTRLQNAHQQPESSKDGNAEDRDLPGKEWRERLAKAKRALEGDGEDSIEAGIEEEQKVPNDDGIMA